MLSSLGSPSLKSSCKVTRWALAEHRALENAGLGGGRRPAGRWLQWPKAAAQPRHKEAGTVPWGSWGAIMQALVAEAGWVPSSAQAQGCRGTLFINIQLGEEVTLTVNTWECLARARQARHIHRSGRAFSHISDAACFNTLLPPATIRMTLFLQQQPVLISSCETVFLRLQ